MERQLKEETMEIKQNWSPIKLKAVDDQDLQIFSQFLFESIVLPSEINFEEKNQQFAVVGDQILEGLFHLSKEQMKEAHEKEMANFV